MEERMLARDWQEQIDSAILESNLTISSKYESLNTGEEDNSENPLLGICSCETLTRVHRDLKRLFQLYYMIICNNKTKTKNWKQPKCYSNVTKYSQRNTLLK